MAAYAALVSLTQIVDLNRIRDIYRISIDAEEQIKSIHEYVIFLLSFLEDFPEKASRWEGEIRDAAHQIEDIVELFTWNRIHSRLKWMAPPGNPLEDELKSVTEKFGSIAGKVLEERPALLPGAVSSSSSNPASTGSDVVMGLDEDLLAIKVRLCGESPSLQVIPIVGMGGIGKTTLASTIYVDPLVVEHFHIRAWVRVSQDNTPQRFSRILSSLLDSMKLSGENMGRQKTEECEMAIEVFQNLKGRRYLVVMDDVWGKEVWDDVSNIFPDDGNGSRIMLTTRLSDVAAYPQPNSPLHELRVMDEYQSWDLLKKRVFTDSHCPPHLEKVGKEIARSCAGLPLAVVLVAGFLSAVNQSPATWGEISKNVNEIVGIKNIMSLSYTHLPHYLRPCFLFIGGLPNDANIRASTLTRLWVAEGFLKHQDGLSKSLEEEAEEYLEDLVKRNLVIVNSRKSNGKIKSCSLHDMVRDLCISKAREEKFLHLMDGHVVPQELMKERRISSSDYDILQVWGSNIRTLLCSKLQNIPNWLVLVRYTRLLRVLNAVGNNDKELPSQVFELFHLRYLALMGSLNIPSAISNLVSLQTLTLHPTFPRQKRYWRYNNNASHFSLPLEIWTMLQLRHLVLYAPFNLPHPSDESNLPRLENLQTLSPVQNFVWNENIPRMIPNVKRLGLVYTVNQEYYLHHLEDLPQLEKLELNGYNDFSWLGQNTSFPRTLKKLTLVGGGYPWENMGIIGSLPNLQVLKLLDYACHGETWTTADEEFSELVFLQIEGSHLQHWETESSPFPRLRCLMLRHCSGLSKIPESIGEILTLELIEVDNCRRSLVESAKQIKEVQQSYDNYDLQVRCGGSTHEGEGGDRLPAVSTSYPVPYVGHTTPADSIAHLQRQIQEMNTHITGLTQQLRRLNSGRAAFQMELRRRQGRWKWLLARGSALRRMFLRSLLARGSALRRMFFRSLLARGSPLRRMFFMPHPNFKFCLFQLWFFIVLITAVGFSVKIYFSIRKHYDCVRIKA